jgi:hypothetical protein
LSIEDTRAFLDRLTQQKRIESRHRATPSAGQRAPEYRVHVHVFGNPEPEVLPLALYPYVVDAPLNDLFRNDETVLAEYLIQPRLDAARAEVASLALKPLGPRLDGAPFLDDDDIDVSPEASSFPKQMDGEERPGRPPADDDDAVAVLKAR